MDSDTDSSPVSQPPRPPPKSRPKRAHGTGTIRIKTLKSGKKLYEGVLQIGTRADGKADRRRVTGHSRQEVEQQLADLGARYRAGGLPNAGRMTLGALLDEWLAQREALELAPRTRANYRGIVANHLRPDLGHVPLLKVTPATLDRYQGTLRSRGLSTGSISLIYKVLRSALTLAEKRGLVVRSPAVGAAPAPQRSPRKHAMTTDELAAFFHHADLYRRGQWAPLFRFLLYTALRIHEVRALRWSDVHSGGVRLPKSKSAAGYRVVPLIGPARVALAAQERLQEAHGIRSAYLFTGFRDATGAPLSQKTAWYAFDAIRTRAQLPEHVTLHTLRRTFITAAARLGINPAITAAIVGHASVKVALDAYTDVTLDDMADATARIGTALARAAERG